MTDSRCLHWIIIYKSDAKVKAHLIEWPNRCFGVIISSLVSFVLDICPRHVLGQDKWQKSLWTCQFVWTCCKVQIGPQMSTNVHEMSTNTPNVHGMSFREGLEDRIWGHVLPTLSKMCWHFLCRQGACPLRRLWAPVHRLMTKLRSKLWPNFSGNCGTEGRQQFW
jgi:hypothetical protein